MQKFRDRKLRTKHVSIKTYPYRFWLLGIHKFRQSQKFEIHTLTYSFPPSHIIDFLQPTIRSDLKYEAAIKRDIYVTDTLFTFFSFFYFFFPSQHPILEPNQSPPTIIFFCGAAGRSPGEIPAK